MLIKISHRSSRKFRIFSFSKFFFKHFSFKGQVFPQMTKSLSKDDGHDSARPHGKIVTYLDPKTESAAGKQCLYRFGIEDGGVLSFFCLAQILF